jgi:hypothetical protein
MGVAATPHCALMCGAPCAALTGGCAQNAGGFHLGRLAGYAAAGAVAASSVAALGAWAQAAPALRPLWTLLHLAFLALGLWWVVAGRQPRWMQRSGAVPVRVAAQRARPLRSGLAGLAWVAWPCAALQAALLLSALATSALGGALVMAAFAVASMPALAFGPWAYGRWRALRGRPVAAGEVATLGYRIAGAGLVLVSAWALTHGVWERLAAWCFR